MQFPPDRHSKQSLTQTNHTRWCINKIRSPDDEHLMLETCRERKLINKYMKNCISLVINKNLWRDARSATYKKDYELLSDSPDTISIRMWVLVHCNCCFGVRVSAYWQILFNLNQLRHRRLVVSYMWKAVGRLNDGRSECDEQLHAHIILEYFT